VKLKRLLAAALAACTLVAAAAPASAKTITSAKADNLFFYATDARGQSVLLKVLPLSELKALAHGQENGENYSISTTDNYPTTQYCEARGFTVGELVDYVKSVTTVQGADELTFQGNDTLRLMATDSYGNYSRSWTWEELYGQKRYYFEGLYSAWNSSWEVGGADNSKSGLTLEEYNAQYRDSDPTYDAKRAVFDTGVETTVILATESYSGRTTGDTLNASTEPGIASYIAANGGTVAGCLKDVISDESALRLSLPMTEADLMSAHRTAYDNFKWIYNLRLDMETAPELTCLGTVDAPTASFSLSGNTLTITLTCATPGASIYYGNPDDDVDAPLILYTGPLTVDVTGRDLSADPVTIYATAVKEGYADAGVQTVKYPGMAPNFQTLYSAMAGEDLTFSAAQGVTDGEWTAWTTAISFLTLKTPAVNGYATVDSSKYKIDNAARTITFDRSLFSESGSYSFLFHAAKYADKSVSVTLKQAAPALTAPERVPFGSPITITFTGDGYNSGLSLYVTPQGGDRTMISSTYLDRTQAGQVTIKADYFAAASTAMAGAGTYTLELVNNSYSPASQTVTVKLTGVFTDVPESAWYYSYVADLTAAGVVNGVGNGLFAPTQTLTWGEALKLLMLTCGYEEQAPTGSYWASGYLDRAVSDELIPAGTDGSAPISRLEFCQTAAKALNAQTTLTASPFSDTADPAVLALYERGIINGTGDGSTFTPDGLLDRSQISKIIWCILKEG
jgi:hypothetical protein